MKLRKNVLQCLLTVALLMCFSSAAWGQTTFPITIDPGNYNDLYKLNAGSSGHVVRGVQVFQLGQGTHTLRIGWGSNIYKSFVVNGDGTVAANPANDSSSSLEFDNTMDPTVRFKNVTINIDAGLFTGGVNMGGVSVGAGQPSIDLVPDNDYWTGMSGHDNSGPSFNVDASGNVGLSAANPNGGDAFIFNGSTLKFKNTTIRLDPQLYQGHFAIPGILSRADGIGVKEVVVIPGFDYVLRLSSLHAAGAMAFGITGAGALRNHRDLGNDPSVYATLDNTINPPTVRFKNVTVHFDPGNYTGGYRLDWNTPVVGAILFGSSTHVLVPAERYQGNIGHTAIGYALDADGNFVEWPSSLLGRLSNLEGSADLDGNTLRFRNENIRVEPSVGTNSSWLIRPGISTPTESDSTTKGIQDLVVVPDLTYSLEDFDPETGHSMGAFDVLAPVCAINTGQDPDFPNELVLGETTYTIICFDPTPPDTDEDGIPDDNDNCPNTQNFDQLDQDIDGLGDACDSDLDGDGEDNGTDNCPDFANADQADADSDDVGDVCDGDDDNDSVSDDADNCPFTPNTDQADSDGDQDGDACDSDDDNDGLTDGVDNCPTTANSDQADFDNDGQGDACDGDDDADGVGDENDICLDTPSNSQVDVRGCNGAQIIEVDCDPADFANHGKYVSCVAQTTNQLVGSGFITSKEKARFVSQAAKKK
jgi:hypothetical protein